MTPSLRRGSGAWAVFVTSWRRLAPLFLAAAAAGAGLALLSGWAFVHIVRQNQEQLAGLLESLPPVLRRLAGDASQFSRPNGFLGAKLFGGSSHLLCLLGMLVGSGMIAADEERGRLDLLVSQPVGRWPFLGGRVAALHLGLLLAAAAIWCGTLASDRLFELGVRRRDVAIASLSLWAQAALFADSALLASQLLPSRWLAFAASFAVWGVGLALKVVVPPGVGLDFLLTRLPASLFGAMERLDGATPRGAIALLLLAAVAVAGTGICFAGRDIRVIGDDSWRPRRLAAWTAGALLVYVAVVALLVG